MFTNLSLKSRKILNATAFVNIVNLMNDLLNPKHKGVLVAKGQENSQFSEKGLYVKEDDQDWGTAGMNNIQKDSDQNQ